MTAIAAILIFFITVLVHEFGHFIVAKKSGVLVHEFAIGMGPKIYSKKGKETLYSLRAIPIGGFCMMEGEDTDSESERSLTKQHPLKRILVMAAGPLMNFILAFVLLAIVNLSIGSITTTIDIVLPDSPAMEAGLIQGDEIVSIDGELVDSWQRFAEKISSIDSKNINDINLGIKRDGELKEVILLPKYFESEKRVMVGIQPTREKNIFLAIKGSFEYLIMLISLMFDFIIKLFSGKINADQVGGPVAVVSQIGEAAKYGILPLLNFSAFISVNLGFFNLLPIPALDGSRIIFAIIEWIRKKPISPEKEGIVHLVGFAFLMLLMLFVTYKDLIKLFG